MARERLYIIHGVGNDAVGLVGAITTPISNLGGNVVDLRQGVLHGLFTLYMVVDLGASRIHIDEFSALVRAIAEETGIGLSVAPYTPIPRDPERKNLLVTLIGPDRTGIIAAASATLGKYKANIESSTTIGREGIFLMELLTDISHCTIPTSNLMTLIEKQMAALGIQAIFQTEDVFNKHKRVILFQVTTSLMPAAVRGELLMQAGIEPGRVEATYPDTDPQALLRQAATLLDGFPLEVMAAIVRGTSASPGTTELLQTLKIMGYKIALMTNACSLLTEHLKERLGIDYAFGVPFTSDDDSRCYAGALSAEGIANRDLDRIGARLRELEQITPADITVISDTGLPEPPGIRVEFDLEVILNLLNDHIVSQEQLLGILGACGRPY